MNQNKSLIAAIFLLLSISAQANGVLRNGLGSRAMSLGGAGTAFSDDPLNAINYDPAALTATTQSILQLNLTTAFLDAEYHRQGDRDNDAESDPGFIPEAAYSKRLDERLTLGASIAPISALEADWEFIDPPGALGVTFGQQTYKSSFLVLRSAAGIGYKVTPEFSIGASVGLLYNRNRLHAPYVFQSHPVLAGALGGVKVLSNLDADDFSVNGVFSASYKPVETLQLKLSYTTKSSFDATGTIRGVAPLGIGAYQYDAEVETHMPQMLSGAAHWEVNPQLRLGFQIDWIDWSAAFSDLPLHLTNGTNAVLNGVVGSNRIDDTVPLNWKDQFVYRFGAEYDWSEKLTLRGGYSYGESPVQSEFLTPTTAAISKHTLGLGAGYRLGNYTIDFAYQWDLPASDAVGSSRLLAGEYSHSEVDVSIHWLSIGIRLGE